MCDLSTMRLRSAVDHASMERFGPGETAGLPQSLGCAVRPSETPAAVTVDDIAEIGLGDPQAGLAGRREVKRREPGADSD